MSTRISESLLVAALLMAGGCDQSSSSTVAKVDPKAPDTVRCALTGAAALEPVCRSDLSGDALVIRHPDGGFRRFRIVQDGRGLIAADGAAPARISVAGTGRIDVQVDGDRYDLPATVAAIP